MLEFFLMSTTSWYALQAGISANARAKKGY